MADTTPKPARVPRFAVIAMALAGLLIIAAGAMIGLATRHNPSGNFLASAIGGPFHLVDQNGKPFTDADLKGKWSLVFFGFTHCDDVCPTTLNELSLAFDKLNKQQQQAVRIVFVSVDSERDTPPVLKSYVENFAAPVVALTGNTDEVRQVAKVYRVYYAKHKLANGGYDMDHSAIIYVMDPEGHFSSTLSLDSTASDMAARLQKLLS